MNIKNYKQIYVNTIFRITIRKRCTYNYPYVTVYVKNNKLVKKKNTIIEWKTDKNTS